MESAVVDGIIVDSPVSDHEAPARPRKRKRSAPAQASLKQRGPLVVVAVCANPNVWGGRVSLWSSLSRATVDDARILVDLPPVNWIDANAPENTQCRIVGLAVVRAWHLVPSDAVEDPAVMLMRSPFFMQKRLWSQTLAFLQCPIVATACLENPVAVETFCSGLTTDLKLQLRASLFRPHYVQEPLGQVVDWVGLTALWQERFEVSMVVQRCIQHWEPLAMCMMRCGWPLIHCAHMCGRVRSDSLLVPNQPSPSQFEHFLRSLVPQDRPELLSGVGAVATEAPTARGFVKLIFDPLVLIRFLRASQHLKDCRRLPAAAKDFLSAFFPDKEALLTELEEASVPCRSLLLWSRVRLGITMMLVHRVLLQSDLIQKVKTHRYLAFAGSPQLGLELFAGISDEIRDGAIGTLQRRRLPIVTLGHGHQALCDKVAAMLWCVGLEVGLRSEPLKQWCDTVRSITTDFGQESGLANYHDVVDAFTAKIRSWDAPMPVSDKLSSLFSRAIMVPGWHHLFDNLLKDATKQLPFWPRFLEKLKGLVKFVNYKSYNEAFVAQVQTHVQPTDPQSSLHRFTSFLRPSSSGAGTHCLIVRRPFGR